MIIASLRPAGPLILQNLDLFVLRMHGLKTHCGRQVVTEAAISGDAVYIVFRASRVGFISAQLVTLTPATGVPDSSCRRMPPACLWSLQQTTFSRAAMLSRSLRALYPCRSRTFASAAAQTLVPKGGEILVGGSSSAESPEGDQRLLQVGIIGVPNAGKSTLTNALVGQKVGCSGTQLRGHCLAPSRLPMW